MEITCNITKQLNADTVVVGGGTAGVFAAISAARSGSKTILIEKNSMLGGTVTVANVNFPGLFFAWGKQIIAGPCWEAIEKTIALGGAVMPKISFKPEAHWKEQILLNRFIYTTVLYEMCRESGVTLINNSMISAVHEETDGVRLIVTGKSGMSQIDAKIVIDATGDANISALAGYELLKSAVQQPATLQNKISGYNIDEVSADEIHEKFKNEDFPEYINSDLLWHYLHLNKIDIHIPCTDADTSEGKTKLEENALNAIMKVYKFFRTIKGLDNLTVDFIAEETGVRETNRIVGESCITQEEYITGYTYPNSVCYAFYPIDLHVMDGIEQTFHKENVVSKIPYTALIPKNSKRVLCAGRCISSDTYANSAIRVEAVCMAMGQAAGCAAAIAAKNDLCVKEVPYEQLCNSLKAIGAIVPEVNE